MVKGINKRVVVIRPSGKGIFEEAIFILRGDAAQTGCSADDILKEACSIANNYMIGGGRKRRGIASIPAPIFAFAGAALTAVVWLLTSL
ncbi:MAG: hypothetical protein GX257_04455 [Clostridiales bacterium]|jgi:hypothetical protein|nr:hypothetical protein [Clostridiales bacterium]